MWGGCTLCREVHSENLAEFKTHFPLGTHVEVDWRSKLNLGTTSHVIITDFLKISPAISNASLHSLSKLTAETYVGSHVTSSVFMQLTCF